jgi:hypothetical protein
MNTDALIERLTESVVPVRSLAVTRALLSGLGAGAIVSFVVMVAWLGIRPDLGAAMQTTAYWMKFFYTLALAGFGFWTVERLSRPGAQAGLQGLFDAMPVLLLAVVAYLQWSAAPVEEHRALMMGRSHTVCPWRIAILSLPIFASVFWSLQRLAPTKPVLAGAAAGLLAGAAGAFIYAFHCNESAAPFVALWYTVGIALVGVAGGLLGRFLLRW